jgi:hypothetical protein
MGVELIFAPEVEQDPAKPTAGIKSVVLVWGRNS